MGLVDRELLRVFHTLARFVLLLFLVGAPIQVASAPYAAMVADGRNGKVLHSRNADTRLHPASLVKMMTMYVAFTAIEAGEMSLDDPVTISRHAANEPPSKLGLHEGQQIALRYLIRAAAVKSANDAATAIAEAISGSEEAFVARMNFVANQMGLSRTTFKNAHGLTEAGQLSTARDMLQLSRRLFFDFPQYYNIFSRLSTDAGIRTVASTNRRLLSEYKGADGVMTGYTRAAGFNLAASAERGQQRVFVVVFGGRSVSWRTARVAELLDMGFSRSPKRTEIIKPKPLPPTPSLSLPVVTLRTDPIESQRPKARPSDAESLWLAIMERIETEPSEGMHAVTVGEFDTADQAMQAAISTNLGTPSAAPSTGLEIVRSQSGATGKYSYQISFRTQSQRDEFCADLQKRDQSCN